MMVKDLLQRIKEKKGVEYSYYKADEEMHLPYIIYFNKDEHFSADNKIFLKKEYWFIEIYTDEETTSLETEIEEGLADIYYTKEKEYISQEDMFVIVYKFELIRKE